MMSLSFNLVYVSISLFYVITKFLLTNYITSGKENVYGHNLVELDDHVKL